MEVVGEVVYEIIIWVIYKVDLSINAVTSSCL